METTVPIATKADRDALFARMFTGVSPEENKQQSMTAVLRTFRRQILAKRREGYSLRQIAERLKASPLAFEVAPSTLREILVTPAAKRRARNKKLAAQWAANRAKASAPAAGTPAPSVPPTTK